MSPSLSRRAWLQGAVGFVALRAVPACAQIKAPSFVAHAIPTPGAKPYLITPGPDGAIWFAESGTGKIGRLDLGTGTGCIPIALLHDWPELAAIAVAGETTEGIGGDGGGGKAKAAEQLAAGKSV